MESVALFDETYSPDDRAVVVSTAQEFDSDTIKVMKID
jgi:hypothetical protein